MSVVREYSTAFGSSTLPSSGAVVDNTINFPGSVNFGIVPVSWGQNNGHSMQNPPSINSVAMSQFGAQTTQGTTNRKHSYYLANPATGSQTLRVDPTTGSADTTELVIEAYGYSGVDVAGTPFDGYNTATGTDGGAPFDSPLTITSATGDKVWVSHSGRLSGGNPSAIAPTNYTEHHETLDGAFAVSSGDADGAASVATTATFSSAGFSLSYNAHGVNLNPSAGGAVTRTLMLMGIGT